MSVWLGDVCESLCGHACRCECVVVHVCVWLCVLYVLYVVVVVCVCFLGSLVSWYLSVLLPCLVTW